MARWLFGSSRIAWIWTIARVWLGWEWLQAGWGKVFGGNITWRRDASVSVRIADGAAQTCEPPGLTFAVEQRDGDSKTRIDR